MSRYAWDVNRAPERQPDRRPERPIERARVPQRAGPQPLNTGDRAAMKAIGTYRVVEEKDLDQGNVKHLEFIGLVQRRTMYTPNGERHVLVSLIPAGLKLQRQDGGRQQYWQGIPKIREASHDASIYRAAKVEIAAIEAAGGRVDHVRLEYEMKRDVYRKLNRPHEDKTPPTPEEVSERRAELGREFNLPVINNKLKMPDAQIHYVDIHGQPRTLDLEVTTRHYSRSMRAGKAAAGFKLVAKASIGKTVYDDHKGVEF